VKANGSSQHGREAGKTSRKMARRRVANSVAHARLRLVVVSVDGMRPEFYRRPDELGAKVPALRWLTQRGASADGVVSVYPSTTYPAHATLVTGVPPRVHGVYSHLATRDPTAGPRPWHWFARALRVPTLWDAARVAGLRTAAIGWPVSAGAALDYNVPEIWDPAAANPFGDFTTAAANSTPGLFDELRGVLQPSSAEVTHDFIRVGAALHLWERYRPELLLVHLVDYDNAAHHFGPMSPQALAALEQSDAEVRRLTEAVLSGGDTALVVLSDHGFVPVEKEVAPHVALAAVGLFSPGDNGHWTLKHLGAIHAGGSFAVYWLEPPHAAERAALWKAVERLRKTGAVARVLGPTDLWRLGADPDAALILDAAPGFFFSDRWEGPIVRNSVEDHGTHGQLPSQPGLKASFVAVGPDIAAGKKLGQFSITRVAATLANLLGLSRRALASRQTPLELGE
jgi:type I phosphodiesterase/nucleotide pyrophosphatase